MKKIVPTFFPILPSLPVNKLYLQNTSIAEEISFSFYSVIETGNELEPVESKPSYHMV